jgi:hypothetical protein
VRSGKRDGSLRLAANRVHCNALECGVDVETPCSVVTFGDRLLLRTRCIYLTAELQQRGASDDGDDDYIYNHVSLTPQDIPRCRFDPLEAS